MERLANGSRAGFAVFHPPRVGLRRVHRLDLAPRLQCLRTRRVFVPSGEIREEVDVAPVLDAKRSALGSIELDRLQNQVAVGDPATGGQLLLAPSIQQI